MNTYALSRIVVILSFLLIAQGALAICAGDAVIVAEPTSDPEAPDWTYTISISWSYVNGVHHWIIPLDTPDGSCLCDDFLGNIVIPDPAGSSDGIPEGCTVPYLGQLECDGDPNSSWEGFLMIFTPDLSGDCQLGSEGLGVFQFQSDFPPVPITDDFFFLAANHAQQTCGMPLTGVFPSMDCNPVGVERESWDTIKSFYR